MQGTMTDTYLRSLGFVPTEPATNASRLAFDHAWRYQHHHLALDGLPLFLEHPFGIEGCRLSALAAPLDGRDVFATVALSDQPGLQAAVTAFYAAHGGVGTLAPAPVSSNFRPFHRTE
ncbi:hypothetical protein GO988_11965 [Hymenobacter sp. HMF4947]|uniref:Uncharacterized protein n=1 Tax=Hymenobacter ginkgonis TaxID=2682976 RepID=A0A7K1TFH3_9BACT|nr:hypothetical protein [Hymenobacter ginkgonis]MVN77042.1 hypothetical protein [Hymenobacter ginkgonis]